MIVAVPPLDVATRTAAPLSRAVAERAAGWRATATLGAILLVLAVSPSSYRGDNRRAVATQLVSTAPSLGVFMMLMVVVAVVVVHIVAATADAYGLSRYALELLLRLLAMELIPLVAVVFVALRIALPKAFELIAIGEAGGFDRLRQQGVDPIQREVLPRLLGCTYAVWLLGVASWVVTGVIAYLTVHGFSTSGLQEFARAVAGTVTPDTGAVFALKVLLFSGAVALVPTAGARRGGVDGTATVHGAELLAVLRLFVVLLLIQVAALIANYY